MLGLGSAKSKVVSTFGLGSTTLRLPLARVPPNTGARPNSRLGSTNFKLVAGWVYPVKVGFDQMLAGLRAVSPGFADSWAGLEQLWPGFDLRMAGFGQI